MKIKKSKLDYIYNTLDYIDGFLKVSLDFIDEDQIEYTRDMISKIEKSLKYLDSVNRGNRLWY